VANDDLWWTALKSLSLRFRHKIVTYDDVTMYLNKALGHDYSLFFDQYLRKIELPVLEMNVVPAGASFALRYRWSGVDVAFDIPVRVYVAGKSHLLHPTTAWKVLAIQARKKPRVEVDRNWFIEPKMVD
jgi:aminopeptidase N